MNGKVTKWMDRAAKLQADARDIFSDGPELEEMQKEIVYNIDMCINLASQSVGLRMFPKKFKPPFTIRECENVGLVADTPANCWDQEFDTFDSVIRRWESHVDDEPDFLRLTDGHGRIVKDYMNFYDEKNDKQIHYEMEAGNPIPIIIAAKVAKKVGKEVIKRVEEKKKE